MMKIKSYNIDDHVLPNYKIEKLGLPVHDLDNPLLAIHANRELHMSKIKVVGFDLDYTLAVYKKRPMELWQYNLARDFLIQEMGYSDNILQYNYEADLVIRGLVIDKAYGTILKLDDQNHICRAMYGKRALNGEEIAGIYGKKRIKISDSRFYSLDTFFSIPEACLFIDTIECLAPSPTASLIKNNAIDFERIFTDIRYAMDTIHSNGSLKTVIGQYLEDFIQPDEGIERTLVKLRAEGKKIFLLTNSSFEYANIILNHVIKNTPWLTLFDTVVTQAQKPQFFTHDTPFLSHAHHQVIVGGNIHDLQQRLGVLGSQVLYVGDHIYGDVLRSKKESFWQTCLIIKELSFDIKKSKDLKRELKMLHRMHEQQYQLDKRLMRFRTLLTTITNSSTPPTREQVNLQAELEREITIATNLLRELSGRHQELSRRVENKYHPLWGRLLREAQGLSRFGAQVRQYACIYTDHVRNFLHYGDNHIFFAKKVLMSHEMDEG